MKTLLVIAIVLLICFVGAAPKIAAQKKGAATPSVESIVSIYFQHRVTSESGGALSSTGFRKTNGYEQGYGLYVIEWQADLLFQQECWKPGDMFAGYWQDFRVFLKEPQGLETVIVGVGTAKHYDKGTTIRLNGNATLRNTEQGWRLEGFETKTSQVLGTKPQGPRYQIKFSDGTRYEGDVRDGKPDGRGVMFFTDDTRQDGIWVAGRYIGPTGVAVRTTAPLPYVPMTSGTTAKTGTFAIKPQFDYAHEFSEGLALVRIGGTDKSGYIDKTGKMVVSPKFYSGDRQNYFSEGLATVRIGDETSRQSGYIDRTGKIVIFPQFAWSEGFYEGFAAVRTYEPNGKWGFIDKNGKMAIPPQFGVTQRFSEGLAAVGIPFGYVNKLGTLVIEAKFAWASNFSEGLAAVRGGDDTTGGWGFIDKTGKWVVKPQFDSICVFSEGLACVRVGDDTTGKWGFIDKAGKMVVTPQFVNAELTPGGVVMMNDSKFVDGLAPVRVGDDKTSKWGYIDKTGKFVISPQFDKAANFSEGLAAVRLGDEQTGKWGYIDRNGKMVIAPQFDLTWKFAEGLAAVRIGDDETGKWGYIYR